MQTHGSRDKLLTPKEASLRLGIQVGTLALWRKKGAIKYLETSAGGRKMYRHRESDVESLIRRGGK